MRYIAPFLGTGKDGPKISSSNEDINPVRQSSSITASSNQLNVTNHASFSDGDLVMIHKSRGTTNAGQFRFARVLSRSSNILTLDRNIQIAFADSGNDQSQVIKVPEWTSWKINSGITVSASAWDGNVGGIIVAVVRGKIWLDSGIIAVNSAGFRGGTSTSSQSQVGRQGEGYPNYDQTMSTSRNGNGGGGGGWSTNSPWNQGNGGGGGGHGSGGENGKITGGGNNANGGGGTKGESVSDAILSTLFFGGGGGAGGQSNNTGSKGAGARGAGIILLFFDEIILSGSAIIRAQGSQGSDAVYPIGSGGGGAGGGISLNGRYGSIGTNLITATGGRGGWTGGDQGDSDGGNGDRGRIRLNIGELDGSTNQGDVSLTKEFDFYSKIGVL